MGCSNDTEASFDSIREAILLGEQTQIDVTNTKLFLPKLRNWLVSTDGNLRPSEGSISVTGHEFDDNDT